MVGLAWEKVDAHVAWVLSVPPSRRSRKHDFTACTSSKIWYHGGGQEVHSSGDLNETDLLRSNLSQGSAFDNGCGKAVHNCTVRDSTISDGSHAEVIATYPTALSAKLRIYFFCSTRSFTSSATCLIEPTRSTTYADLPLTFSKFIHGVFSIAANAGSQAPSSSRCRTTKHADMTLSC